MSTIVPRFVDTDVLFYSISTDTTEGRKRTVAESIFDARDLALSAQVLGEFYVQATRPARSTPITHEQAVAVVQSMGRYPIQPLTDRIVDAALRIKGRYSISCWDATIIEAARAAGCAEVLSEDLADGGDYDGVVVRNPFGEPAP